MDIPSSTPRRNGQRNPAAHDPYTPKHVSEIFSITNPPPLHSRSTNESWNPQPTIDWQTPSSSPAKTSGSQHLAELFDRSLQLPPSPAPGSSATPPPKRFLGSFNDDTDHSDASIVRSGESDKRSSRYKKENTNVQDQAGAGLQRSTKKKYNPFRDMTPEEIEKLSNPSVKRLKDVAHLCKSLCISLLRII